MCCNCRGDHNASLRRCPARPRPVREPQTPGTTVGPSRVVFRPVPAPQHNAWANGAPSWSDFPALPLPAAQPSAFPPLSGTAAPSQSGAAHPPVPATWPLVPVPRRTAFYHAAVVGAEDAAPASQAGVPATLQDVVQLLLGVQAKIRDLTPQPAHKNQPQSVPASPQPQPVSATVQPATDNKPQSVPASPRPQPVSATVQPAPDNKPQSAPASPRSQPVSVPVHPSPQSAPDSQPQSVPASSRPQRVQPLAPVQPPLPPAPA
ncbi:predicted GPI-anchored protein 58 [Portunus trituberculatus]|uniref:predicted GPI-anchored protein 58 n=1 Tax=Portunus trituberculatus TaxID=210409 RepID=UPI001E1CB89A|nr:predicted GPI-anchored protein 58 [Portunus trituberculatus]